VQVISEPTIRGHEHLGLLHVFHKVATAANCGTLSSTFKEWGYLGVVLSQEEVLSTYPASQETNMDVPSPDDFAQLPLVTPERSGCGPMYHHNATGGND
jgi:hypothetical protein